MKIPDLWKKNRRFPVVSSIIVLCAAAIFFIGYRFHWRTGFADKTFWDWMQLLIVPFMLTIGGLWFSQVQQTKERDVAERNAKTEKDIALDNQRESLLQTYLDRMSELLLDKHLLDEETNKNKAPDLARARTLTALSRLDPVRKGSLVQFLREAGLIKRYKGIHEDDRTIISMEDANLSQAYLVGAGLLNIDLSNANLSKANLSRAYMTYIRLSRTDLTEANLVKAFVTYADLTGAILRGANLTEVNLFRSDLGVTDLDEIPTDLRGANLARAKLMEANLTKAILIDVDLTEASLEKANLAGADLTGANFTKASMKGANLKGAKLTGAIISKQQMDESIGLEC